MNISTAILADDSGKYATSGGSSDRVFAIAEVIIAFVAVHVTYRAIKYFTLVGQWDPGRNFIPGAVMIAFTIAVLLLCRRNFDSYGLGLKRWSQQLSLGLVCSFLLIGAEAIGRLVTKSAFVVNQPPDAHAPDQFMRLARDTILDLPAILLVFALVFGLLRTKGRIAERILPAVCSSRGS